jgi:hypothetical protein
MTGGTPVLWAAKEVAQRVVAPLSEGSVTGPVTSESEAATVAIWRMLIERWSRVVRYRAPSPNRAEGAAMLM